MCVEGGRVVQHPEEYLGTGANPAFYLTSVPGGTFGILSCQGYPLIYHSHMMTPCRGRVCIRSVRSLLIRCWSFGPCAAMLRRPNDVVGLRGLGLVTRLLATAAVQQVVERFFVCPEGTSLVFRWCWPRWVIAHTAVEQASCFPAVVVMRAVVLLTANCCCQTRE